MALLQVVYMCIRGVVYEAIILKSLQVVGRPYRTTLGHEGTVVRDGSDQVLIYLDCCWHVGSSSQPPQLWEPHSHQPDLFLELACHV